MPWALWFGNREPGYVSGSVYAAQCRIQWFPTSTIACRRPIQLAQGCMRRHRVTSREEPHPRRWGRVRRNRGGTSYSTAQPFSIFPSNEQAYLIARKHQARLVHALRLLVPGMEHLQQTCPASEACGPLNLVFEWTSSCSDAAQILFLLGPAEAVQSRLCWSHSSHLIDWCRG
jgi:hypothetical protein